MTWTTSHGFKVEHPLQAAGKQPKDWDERDKQWVQKYTHLHEQAMRMDMELVTLRAENLRLKHENEFMLRLINERENQT